jgi:WD40 repeat protein
MILQLEDAKVRRLLAQPLVALLIISLKILSINAQAQSPDFVIQSGEASAKIIMFSPDGRYMATESLSGVKLWDVRSLRELRSLLAPQSRAEVDKPFFSIDGKLLFALDAKAGLKTWQVADDKELMPLPAIKDSSFD